MSLSDIGSEFTPLPSKPGLDAQHPDVWPNAPLTFDSLFSGGWQSSLDLLDRPNRPHPLAFTNQIYQIKISDHSAPKNAISSDGPTQMRSTALGARLESSKLFFNDRLTLSGGLAWDRSIQDQFGSPSETLQSSLGFDTMTYGFGADLRLNEQWSLGASLTARKSSDLKGRPSALSMDNPWFSMAPSDLLMGGLGVQFFRPDWGFRARMSVYAGQIGQAGLDRSQPKSDLTGLELNLQKSIIDGRLNFELATMFNYLNSTGNLHSLSLHSGRNLSAYFGVNFSDPTLFNASVLLRYAGDGNYINNYFLTALGASSFLDARIWRDFNLSPVLTLTTQLYGSNLIEAYYRNLTTLDPTVPYLEGRVTMSYSF
ncbi:MAG: hypothetical protein LBT47_13075 [Deltaproteobacteria bacterium]|nr:hypothetical protein [Deltaproteobacteria bacterium]